MIGNINIVHIICYACTGIAKSLLQLIMCRKFSGDLCYLSKVNAKVNTFCVTITNGQLKRMRCDEA